MKHLCSESLAAKLQLNSTVSGLFSVRYAIPSPISKSKSLWCQFSDLRLSFRGIVSSEHQRMQKNIKEIRIKINVRGSTTTCNQCNHVQNHTNVVSATLSLNLLALDVQLGFTCGTAKVSQEALSTTLTVGTYLKSGRSSMGKWWQNVEIAAARAS